MLAIQKGRLLLLFATLAGAASAVSPAARLKSNYELALQTERLTEALVGNRSRDIYRMFTPPFAAEHSFARFDSALSHWSRGRRIIRASHKVVEIKGPAGYVSSWLVFAGARDYNYVYQSWLNTPHGWQLVWLSRILDSTFSYGQTDSLELVQAAEVGLRYVLSKPGLTQFRSGFRRPDTVVMLRYNRPGEGEFRLDGVPVYWTSMPEILQGGHVPRTQFLLSLALVRLMDDMALVAIDVTPTVRGRDGRTSRRRGIEVYLERAGSTWRYRDIGKVW
jgi:hypothetical protein